MPFVMRLRDAAPRLAAPMSRRPLLIAVVALLIGLLGATGLFRFAVDAGQSLLVGSSSDAGQTYQKFSQTFGSDPIVIVFSTRAGNTPGNITAPYIERNLQRLGALEIDLAHDPRVASVLGPGTVAGSLRQAAVSEVSKVLTEYPYFIAETDYLEQLQKGNTNQQDLTQRLQSDISNATLLLEAYVLQAARDAHNARAQYQQQAGDLVVDTREKMVDAAVGKDMVPPLWAEYLAGPTQAPNQTAAAQFFTRVAAAYGDCSDQIAALLKIQSSCQVFFERTLLDLPHCPPVSSQRFCEPKAQWAAVLPAVQPGSEAFEIVTVRIKPQYVGDQNAMSSLKDKINSELARGIADDSYTRSLSSASRNSLKSLGALNPTQCGSETAAQDPACVNTLHDAKLSYTIAGAPLLGLGVVRSMSQLLAILFPVALFVMLLLLVAIFRVRGRLWPLLAAIAATVLTVGAALLTGTPITPAVLAGVPVLVGLGVDYAVQLVARYSEERSRGVDIEAALRAVIGNTGSATLIAAAATLAGLAALALFGGVDWGPLVAVPLVAEFALVLCGGVVLAWLGALFIALPLTVWADLRQPIAAHDGVENDAESTRERSMPVATRTIAIADNWRGVVALATVLALFGWVALHFVPVQTDVQHLLSQSLPELGAIQTVQAETGYTNEIDVYLRGQVATGPINAQTGNPTSVEWQCGAASDIRTNHANVVVQASSIGDYVIAAGSGPSSSGGAQCVPTTTGGGTSQPPSVSPSPSAAAPASPSAAATPSASASPTTARQSPVAQLATEIVAREAAATPPASATTVATTIPSPVPSGTPGPSGTGAASPKPSGSASPSPSPGAKATPTQTRFLCDLRLFPPLSRTLVMNISPDTLACPPVDEYRQTFLTADTTPINPDQARIAVGVHTDTVAQQAKLVDVLATELKPVNGMSAAPTGLAVLATTAYDNLLNRAYLLNLAPLAVVALVLFAIFREPRRALLPLIPTVLAAGWAPLVLIILGHLPGVPGDVQATLGSLNPLTVVLGALVVALGTEFGVVLLGRFYEERRRGLDPDAAAGASLFAVGRAIRVSALTLGAGFAVLAISGFFPNSLPLVADFGLAVVIDLALAVAAVFLVMLPAAVALERAHPLQFAAVEPTPVPAAAAPRQRAAGPRSAQRERPAKSAPVAPDDVLTPDSRPRRRQSRPKVERAAATPADEAQPRAAEPTVDASTTPEAAASEDQTPPEARPRRLPGVSGRRRQAARDDAAGAEPGAPHPPRRPGVSGRRRRR